MGRIVAVLFFSALFACAFPASDRLYRQLLTLPRRVDLESSLREIAQSRVRLAGTAGEARTMDVAEGHLRRLGYRVKREPFTVTVPDPSARGLLTFSGQGVEALPLWPNLVRTSTCDVAGTLTYGGDGSLEALAGLEVANSIVVLEFDTQARWNNAARLGAKAILFLPSEDLTRFEAEAKFTTPPLDVPRFLLGRSAAGAIRQAARRHTFARLRCRQDWIVGPSANLIAELPGSNPSARSEPIVISAYADAMSVAPGESPGAEQAAGLAVLLELARVEASQPRRRPLRILVLGAHCLGLQGAREYVERRLSEGEPPPLLVATLDLASATKSLGVFGRGYAYNYRDEILDRVLPLCRTMRRHAEQLTPLLGETLPRLVLTDAANHSDNRTWRNNIPARFAFDCEPFMSAGYAAVTFATIDDARRHVDTPDDGIGLVNFGNLLRQSQILTVLLHHVLNDPVARAGEDVVPLQIPSVGRIGHLGGFATLSGYLATYDPARSLVPDVRLAGSLAVRVTAKKALMGVRGNDVQVAAGPNAEYRFLGAPPLTDYATLLKPDTIVLGYHLDPRSGTIDYAPDEGPFGADAFPLVSALKTSSRSSPVVLFRCRAANLFGLVDPQDLTPLGSASILDPAGGSRPRNYGIARSYYDQSAAADADDGAVIFLPESQPYQLLMSSQSGEERLLLTGSSPGNLAGTGYRLEAGLGDVTLRAAQDLCALNEGRIEELARHRVLAETVQSLHKEAERELGSARAAEKARDWEGAQRHGRAAWGLALRAYPMLRDTATDIVDGVLFYSFLLIPFSFFFERLFLASRTLGRQVIFTTVVFVLSFVLLRALHPAFDLVANPPMIFVGFVMGALSLIVATFIIGRFETGLRSVKQAQSGIREIDVRRSNVAMAAFNLGVSNLRRRKARTLLTTLTLAVMTFIVLSFTSIVPEIKLAESASSNAARYSGILLRQPGFEPLQGSSYEALANEFQGRAVTVRRVFSFGPDILSGAAMSMERNGRWADASAAEGLDPDETLLSRPQDALLPSGRWFARGERYAIVLPAPMAEALDIQPRDVGSAKVSFMGSQYTVIGIVAVEKMRGVVDLDGESLVPPDFSLSQREQVQSRSQTQAFRKFIRLDPATCFFLPAETALALGGTLRSVAVGFANPRATQEAMGALMPRLRLNLYASVPGDGGLEVRRFSILQGARASGLGLVLIQLLIASVFVLNTMIASVFERTREISIFSAIGLSPSHISTLFFAESLVYGILGVVTGYFAAQALQKVIVATGWFPQLTLNFSSASAISSALLILGLVVASTIYPARKAAAIAAPAMAKETLELIPDSDEWTVRLPFTVSPEEAGPMLAFLGEWLQGYEEYSIGAFVTGETRMESSRLASKVWLAPYDLGVAQGIRIDAVAGAGATAMMLTIDRVSGEPANWIKLNRRFLALLRRQFLAWRTLTDEERARFLT